VGESFQTQFNTLHDWTNAKATGLDARLTRVEREHGSRLLEVELRVMRLARSRRRKKR